MWGFASNAITSIGLKRSSSEPSRVFLDSSDDEVCSNSSREEELECPICLESFNIVENVPHVLWCGHTLCRNCVLALQWAVFRFSTQKFNIPFFISCPWCHLFSLRLVYKGNLKFPRKNFFLLWMVESFNGDRAKFDPASNGENQQISSPRVNLATGNQAGNSNLRRNHSSCPLLSRQCYNFGTLLATHSSFCNPICLGIVLFISYFGEAGKGDNLVRHHQTPTLDSEKYVAPPSLSFIYIPTNSSLRYSEACPQIIWYA